MVDTRNMILAIVLAIVILLGSNIFFGLYRTPPPEPVPQVGQAEQPALAPEGVAGQPAIPAPMPSEGGQVPSAPGAPGAAASVEVGVLERVAVLDASPRVAIRSPRLHGTISLAGGRIDDLTLADYREELDPESPEIVILSPPGTADAYFARFGWVAADETTVVPGADTVWTTDGNVLTPDSPLTLRWDNGQGLRFSRTFALDRNFMFTVTHRVENTGDQAVDLFPFGLVSRRGTPEVTGYVILHEGMLGVFDGTLEEIDYDDLQEKEKGVITKSTTGGWIGFTDKYWLTALIPGQRAKVDSRFYHHSEDGIDKYQVDFVGARMTVDPGAAIEEVNNLFVGAKEVQLLDAYAANGEANGYWATVLDEAMASLGLKASGVENLGIARFDLAIDFGWLYFLTKPIFYTLIYINQHVGNFGVSILLLTVLVKLLFFPLANKSYKAMSKMKKLQPEVVKLRERFPDDKQRLNQEMMALYKREKANPAAGCLPLFVQIPVFFALYKVLFVTIEMRHAPFFGWIQDLSVSDPTSVFNLFGLIPWEPALYLPEVVNIGVWPLIMGFSMFLQQKLNPQPADPMQAKIFMFLPILFTFLLARFPAGLVIYWAWNNVLSIIQQRTIMYRMGVKV